MTTQSVRCSMCGISIDEYLDAPEGRRPCPQCGSTVRQFNVEITEELKLRESAKKKKKS